MAYRLYNIPSSWLHCRTWDYHTAVSNPIIFASLSPQNECFIWNELNIDPKENTIYTIADKIAEESGNYIYRINDIDPMAGENQPSTGTSLISDINKLFSAMKHTPEHPDFTGGYWIPYDTRYHAAATGSIRGRDQIKERLRNSSKVSKPFNNYVKQRGLHEYLPTLWITSNCRQTLNSLYRWRMESNGKPCQRWSHHCTALEGLMKDARFKPRMETFMTSIEKRRMDNNRKTEIPYFRSR